jgi:RND family efflux transporter MFP subunit
MKNRLVLGLLPLLIAACHHEAVPEVKVERPAMTILIGAQGASSANTYTGEIRARHELPLSFRLNGKVVERLVDVGSRVKVGQILARLDATDSGLQDSAAQAQLKLAEDELSRARELRAKNFVSESNLQAKETAYQAALAQAGLSRNQKTYTQLIAENNGVVSATLVEVGQVVNAGQPILRVAQDGNREVLLAIPESAYAGLKLGMSADIEWAVEGAENKHFSGRLRELSPMADPQSRTFPAKISLNNQELALALGMTVRVRFGLSEKKSGWLVPLSALFQQGEQVAVWVVAADRSVSLRPVKVSAYRDEGAVISSGVVAGERIIAAGVHKLMTGDKVQIFDGGTR